MYPLGVLLVAFMVIFAFRFRYGSAESEGGFMLCRFARLG